MKIIDLFCGCGGMTLGFQKAGFEVVAGLENWDDAIICYNKNFKHKAIKIDLSDINISAKTIKKYSPDIIIGGPPCQDFSGAGNRIEGNRADLTIAFAKIVKEIHPEYFVMENVERAYNSTAYKKARKIFKECGYGLTEKVLDASFCNVPQKRKRFFCIGHKYGNDGFLEGLLSTNQSIFPLTVREYFSKHKYSLRSDFYYRHPRSYNRRGIFSIDEPSPTIRGVNRPKPSNYKRHPGDVAMPDDIKNLTYKERAFIQTFPKGFVWGEQLSSVEQMIGNAVPVNLAHYVASCLMKFINGDQDLHNLRFVDWLITRKGLSVEVAGDTLSRIGRARRVLAFGNLECKDYIEKLSRKDSFLKITKSVQAQIKRAIRLYFEYIKVLNEGDLL